MKYCRLGPLPPCFQPPVYFVLKRLGIFSNFGQHLDVLAIGRFPGKLLELVSDLDIQFVSGPRLVFQVILPHPV